MIEYLGVWKSFDEPVLRGVDLTVKDGEILSIVGPSGTGKSVLLKTTLGLVVPDGGDVRIDGQSVVTADAAGLEEIRKKVSYVFQNAALFDSLTVFDNVAQGLRDAELRSIGLDDLQSKVEKVLREVNLDFSSVASKIPSELSGGMRKRVGLARALIGDAQILLYDEPVTGLDPINVASVERLISQIRDERGVTSVIVTHDVEGALLMSDRVALLEGGRIRFVGPPDAFSENADPMVRSFAHRGAAEAAAEKMAITAQVGGLA